MKEPVLQVRNLSIDFNESGNSSNAVKNISFDVATGEILAIVGESGSGKSVTALSLMQLLPLQAIVNGQLFFTNKNSTAIDF